MVDFQLCLIVCTNEIVTKLPYQLVLLITLRYVFKRVRDCCHVTFNAVRGESKLSWRN